MKVINHIDDILTEWSYKLKNGSPDIKNKKHIRMLERVLFDMGFKAGEIIPGLESLSGITEANYVDNSQNRKLNRVGKEWGTGGKQEPKKKEEPEKDTIAKDTERDDKPKQQSNGYIGDKDKTLTQGDTVDTDEYKRDLEPNDEKFNEKNKANANPSPPEQISLDGIVKDPKFPKRYMKVLERMMNTKSTKASAKYSNFSDIEGGQGKIGAQAGELMSMVGTAMSDEEFNTLTTKLLDHEQKLLEENPKVFMKQDKKTGKWNDNPGSRIINKSWIESAKKTRKVMKDQIKKTYGEGAEIVATAWDAKDEVEAMGLKDYKKNKGFSTDMYIKVKKPNGEQILVEVSLKKDKNVNFLNSGTGKLIDLDPSLKGTGADPKEYSRQEKTRLTDGAAKILPKKLLNSPDIQNALKVLKGEAKGKARSNSKLIRKAIEAEKNKGNKDAIAYIDADDKAHREMQERAVEVINTNKKVREGVIEDIKNEFPLKGVSDGEETMAIGDMSLDRHTMEKVFGTSNFEELKERFKVKKSTKGEPYLAYSVEGEDEIPIASIGIRQDGRGYGGSTIKFEMSLHSKLAEKLKAATEEVYK